MRLTRAVWVGVNSRAVSGGFWAEVVEVNDALRCRALGAAAGVALVEAVGCDAFRSSCASSCSALGDS